MQKYNITDSFAVEIDIAQYGTAGKKRGIDLGLYAKIAIQWKLTGANDDIIRHNQLEVFRASQHLPNIAYAIKNYLDGATPTISTIAMPTETVSNPIPQNIKNKLQKAISKQ